MKKILAFLSFSLLMMTSIQLKAGDGYVDISPAQPTQSGDKIEVLEIFWYGCPHCYDFEPFVKGWLESKPEEVEFRRMPGIFNKTWIPHGKAYFTAKKLGILETIHNELFDAMHKKKQRINDDAAIRKFFIKQGVDKAEFTKVYESDEVMTKVNQAHVMGQRYKVTGVPAVIVNGKYMVSSSTAGSFGNVLKVIDQLVDKERANAANE